MVSQYNSAVAMFGRTGSGHIHHYHASPATNPYFTPTYGGYPHHYHPQGATPNPSVSVTSTQFSPNMPPDFNCNNHYSHQLGHMTSADTTAAIAAAASAAPWNHPYSACHRNIPSSYEDWSHHQHGHHPLHHPSSFYSHQQPSPPSSTPSPNSSSHHNHQSHHAASNNNNSTSGTHSPSSYNNSSSFKTEFGPCSGGNPQENSSQEMQGPVVVTSAAPSIGTPHSPDSGMAISDGVSSSGSPATGVAGQAQQQQQQHCLGGAPTAHHHLASSLVNGAGLIGSQQAQNANLNHQQQQQQQQQALHQQQQQQQRPAQARSPFEWMKKPSYNVSSNNDKKEGAVDRQCYQVCEEYETRKTRTKDKYRVVYSDTQRLELEKEFHYSRYITIRRKAELASILGLSERQVKIWFQNRRAKERKVVRKREEMIHREKIATMVHMQAAGIPGGVGGPMCNQGNGNSIPPLM